MRTHNTPRLCAGPQTAGTPIKFWNVASTGDDEGEITLYGDVVSRQPVDWWTGEPEPGLYIAPESFMEDLAAVKGKSNITIKINSCGGDLYTGIAIHNAIKGLTGHKVVVVEGIAASAASVIACAGDEVQVYPGSMVMIHGVAGLLYDYYTLADLKKLQKDFDASERAIAEIYHAKTGIEVDQLRSMMTRETVVLLSKGEIDSKKVRVEFSLEDMDMSGFQKGATYEQIKTYVLEHSGLKVSSLYISQVKRKCGLDVGQNYNLSKKEDAKVPQCPPEKERAIRDALKFFHLI